MKQQRSAIGGAVAAMVRDAARVVLVALVVVFVGSLLLGSDEVRADAPEPLATVGDAVITLQEYSIALRTEARRRFYHTQPPEKELQAFHREVADRLIERQLALQEARRRGVRVDTQEIESRIKSHQDRTKPRNGGKDDKVFWASLRRELEMDQLVKGLRDQVRSGLALNDAAVLAYYQGNRDKFTEPESTRLSALLLKVAPSSAQDVWTAATEEARRILKQIRAGAAFDEMARLHSGDGSAAKGGDLGYVHKGMLGNVVEDAVVTLRPGEISEPLTVLEGVALFKLHDRKPPVLHEFAQVKQRAREFLQKESEEKAWRDLMGRLRAGTTIKLQEKYLTPS